MELVAGRPLRALLEGGALPMPALLSLAAQMAGALAGAHEAGVVHRDLTPVTGPPAGLSQVGSNVKIFWCRALVGSLSAST